MYGALRAILILALKICIAHFRSEGEAQGPEIEVAVEVWACHRVAGLEARIGCVYGAVPRNVDFGALTPKQGILEKERACRYHTWYTISMTI